MPDLTVASPRGSITISRDVVAEIVTETAVRCYGVVGLGPRSKVGRLLRRDGIRVGGDATCERTVPATSVRLRPYSTTTWRPMRIPVAYDVERLTGLPVEAVEVVVEDVRVGA